VLAFSRTCVIDPTGSCRLPYTAHALVALLLTFKELAAALVRWHAAAGNFTSPHTVVVTAQHGREGPPSFVFVGLFVVVPIFAWLHHQRLISFPQHMQDRGRAMTSGANTLQSAPASPLLFLLAAEHAAP
jgi:hypothetical protein